MRRRCLASSVCLNAIHFELAGKHGVTLCRFLVAGAIGGNDLVLGDRIDPSAKPVRMVAQGVLPSVRSALTRRGEVAA